MKERWENRACCSRPNGQEQISLVSHYYRYIPNLTRQDGSALDKAAAAFGL